MAGQPTASAHRSAQQRLGPLAGLFLVQAQDQRDGERGGHHAQHAERGRDEGLLHDLGATHPDHDVARGIATELVADAVHDAADQHPVQAQPDGPQQQGAAVQPPGQPESVAQQRCCAGRSRAFGDQPGADVAAGQQPVGQRGEQRRRRQMQQQHPPPVARVRADLQRPAQRRKPRQCRRTRRHRRRAA